jgi:hypothetical protein
MTFDATSLGTFASTVTSLTWNHTCAGSDRLLFVAVSSLAASSPVSGITYNGVALTKIAERTSAGGATVELWYLIAPATGTHAVVVSCTSTSLEGGAASYADAKQSGVPDASVTTAPVATSVTATLTTVADNAWSVLAVTCGATPAAGTNSTQRQASAFGLGLFDSNGPKTPPGSFAMTATAGGSQNWAAVMASFAPPAFDGGRMLLVF